MPKVPKIDLFLLISSLSPSEKRQVRRYFRQRSPEKVTNTEKLLDAMAGLKEHDESELRTALPPALAQNLGYEKHQLMKQLLQALRMHQSEIRVDLRIGNMVSEARILLEKGLYEAGMKKLSHAKTGAVQYELIGLQLDILTLERTQIKRVLSKSVEKEIQELDRETFDLLRRINEQSRLRQLADQIFILVRQEFGGRTEEDRDKLNRLAAAQELDSFPETGTFESKKLFLTAKAHIAQYNRGHSLAMNHYQSILELWDRYPAMVEIRTKDYKTTLANYLQMCHQAGNHDNFPAILKKLKTIPAETLEEEVEDFQNIVFLEFLWKMNMKDPMEALSMIPDIETAITRYGAQMNQSRRITLCYNIAVLLFVVGEMRESFFWTHQILDITRSSHRKDIRNFARVFEIVLHYELSHWDTLSYFFQNAYRVLKRRQRLHAFEKAVLQAIHQLDGVESRKKIKEGFEKLEKKLLELALNEKGKKVLGFAEMNLWVQSKITGKTMLDILKNGSKD